jgi:hypothetical protein
MSSPRQSVLEYVQASEDIIKLKDLTDGEIEVVQEMSDRLSEMLTSQHNSEP